MVLTIILAAGLQFNPITKLPSVLDSINEKPRLFYHIKQALSIRSSHVLIVVGKYRNLIEPILEPYFIGTHQIHYIDQVEDFYMNAIKVRGTGDAIKCCMPFLLSNQISFETNIFIIQCNAPLLSSKTINRILRTPNTILVANIDNPSGYGRIILNPDNTIVKIVEDKECTDEETRIKWVNYGVYNIHLGVLDKFLPTLTNKNKRKEYYFTDIIKLANKNLLSMTPCEISKNDKVT
jgi:bifunctional UDP-N-acetylglucosamine pyrophosphorylase / glucosamine-1-phosphate N-acetyltransferase